jgi:hypothetical protein
VIEERRETNVAHERYALRRVQSPADWASYHAIRRSAIFAALLPGQAYDEETPTSSSPATSRMFSPWMATWSAPCASISSTRRKPACA